ncbi:MULTISPECIES: response regulator [Paenibacillus]|uniref:AraC family transcriptional regulator n=1 Tax=Paenibacillus illinoisensis TaxID=59845 RepID=A0A2W0C9Q9_9BACL|nr:response regulator [Paenibacillus illinoisensis]PYY25085.1 AraC family transcriptional regulator [Paenibacillus illinoisensis]
MYKVLLVDDEWMILDGIASVMSWNRLGTELIGTAQDGLEALAFIELQRPDIIITDIRMPGMDGLQLVEAVTEMYQDISFVMLTGFTEFEYAKRAMQYGVKHYLLKPCSEESLMEAIAELVGEKDEWTDQAQFVQTIQTNLERVLPHAKQYFLKELVTNKTYGAKEWGHFGELFGVDFRSQQVRMLLVEIEGEHEYLHLFAIQNIAEDVFHNPILSTTLGRHVLLIMEDKLPEKQLFHNIDEIRHTFTRYYHYDLTMALSEPGELAQTRQLYMQTISYLNHRFYLGEGSLIMERDILSPEEHGYSEFEMDQERLVAAIQAGHWQVAEDELKQTFCLLSDQRYDIFQTKSYLIQTFMEIIRLSSPTGMKEYMDRLPCMMESSTLQSFQLFILDTARDIALERYRQQRSRQSQMVQAVKELVESRYEDESLTLQAIAGEIYMNPDYIGKIFKKETGEKFTNYVLRYRMGKALELLKQDSSCTVSSLAEKTGFGANWPYFSKVFKKYTGFSPSEYKKVP